MVDGSPSQRRGGRGRARTRSSARQPPPPRLQRSTPTHNVRALAPRAGVCMPSTAPPRVCLALGHSPPIFDDCRGAPRGAGAQEWRPPGGPDRPGHPMPSGPSPWGVLGGPSALLGRVQGQSRARRQARRQWWDIGTSRRDPAPRSASTRPSGRNPSGPADLQPKMIFLFLFQPLPPLFPQQPLPSQSRPPKSQETVHKSQTVASAVLCRTPLWRGKTRCIPPGF